MRNRNNLVREIWCEIVTFWLLLLSSAGGASCVPVGGTKVSGKGLKEVGKDKAGGKKVSIGPHVAKNKDATVEPMEVEQSVPAEGDIDESL